MHLTGHGNFLVVIVMLRSFIKYTNEKCVCMAVLKMISFTRDKNNCKIWHVRRTHNFRQIVQMLCVLSDQSVKTLSNNTFGNNNSLTVSYNEYQVCRYVFYCIWLIKTASSSEDRETFTYIHVIFNENKQTTTVQHLSTTIKNKTKIKLTFLNCVPFWQYVQFCAPIPSASWPGGQPKHLVQPVVLVCLFVFFLRKKNSETFELEEWTQIWLLIHWTLYKSMVSNSYIN